jgi:hypothetical protein
MANKHIDLFKEIIPAVDLGMKDLWDAATDEGRKEIKGDFWNLNRYISSVKSSDRALQEHFVLTVNEYYNKNWSVLGTKHPKLQWQLLCQAAGTGKIEYHQWIGFKQKGASNSKSVKLLQSIYPNMKQDEVELLARISTKKELKQLAEDHNIEHADL